MTFIHACTSDTNAYIVRDWWSRAYCVLIHVFFVLHIGIYLYCTNTTSKKTHKSFFCFQHVKYLEKDKVECLVVFHCMSWLMSFARAHKSCKERESSEHYKMKNSCPQWDLKPVSFAYKANTVNISLQGLMPIQLLTVYRFLLMLLLEMYL